MKILVIGSGGREHAIVMKLAENPENEVFCTPGNGGIGHYAECFDVQADNIEGVTKLAKRIKADYVFVTPDNPLVDGMVDVLNENGIKTFGPTANAAVIEGSKVFAKNFMKRHNIPTADYADFSDYLTALEYITAKNQYPIVIKADGLALGKGVIIVNNQREAMETIIDVMLLGKFGDSGKSIVIEECLSGPEVSVLVFTDGESFQVMPTSMDHKRALDGDNGPNTGGMGTISPNPLFTESIQEETLEKIIIPTISAMKAENRQFKGCLYFGLMLTDDGVKVIEYNCRFGDPETQVVLPLLDMNFNAVIEGCYNSTLKNTQITIENSYCCCVVLACGGYPEKYRIGEMIHGLNNKGQLNMENVYIYHAGTKYIGGRFYTSAGRVLGVTAKADTLQGAIDLAYSAVKEITFKNMQYRTDIGTKAL